MPWAGARCSRGSSQPVRSRGLPFAASEDFDLHAAPELSMSAVSYGEPVPPIDGQMPASVSVRLNAHEVNRTRSRYGSRARRDRGVAESPSRAR